MSLVQSPSARVIECAAGQGGSQAGGPVLPRILRTCHGLSHTCVTRKAEHLSLYRRARARKSWSVIEMRPAVAQFCTALATAVVAALT